MGAGTEKETLTCACYAAHEERFKHIADTFFEIKDAIKNQTTDIRRIDKVGNDALASMKSFHKRLDKVEVQTEAILELSYSVKGLSDNVASMMGNFQKQEEAVNERFEKQAVVIDARFEKQTEVILNLATEQSKASKEPGAFALKAWWLVIGIVLTQVVQLAFKLMATAVAK